MNCHENYEANGYSNIYAILDGKLMHLSKKK